MILIKLPKEQKDELVRSMQTFFETERSETIGNLAAEQLIDYMLAEVGPFIYNKAIEDARSLVQQKASEIEDELYALERPIKKTRKQ